MSERVLVCCFLYAMFASYVVEANLCAQYRIPPPTFGVYKPNGLQISIPDDNGINLVVFYVSINKGLSETNADYTQYVLNQTNGKWIFDKSSIHLRIGDYITYKIYVQKYHRGYLYRGTPFIVTDTTTRPELLPRTTPPEIDDCHEYPNSDFRPTTSTTTPVPSTRRSATTSTTSQPVLPSYEDCSTGLNTALKFLSEAHKELAQLRGDNAILKELASAQPFTLYLSGLVTAIGEPKEVVEFILYEKLDTRLKVKNATKKGTTITFELFTFEEKLDVLRRTRKYLKDSKDILISS